MKKSKEILDSIPQECLPKVETKKMGRPRVYRPEMCQALIDIMSKGGIRESFCAAHDICAETFHAWIKEFPEFSDAYREARQKQRDYWFKILTGASVGKIPKAQMQGILFIIKNITNHEWKDKGPDEVKLSGDLETRSTVTITDEYLDKLIDKAKTK